MDTLTRLTELAKVQLTAQARSVGAGRPHLTTAGQDQALIIAIVEGIDSVLMAFGSSDQLTTLHLRAVKELSPGSGLCRDADRLPCLYDV